VTGADDWDLPDPHVSRVAVQPSDVDAYDHVNNAVYVAWLDRAAWEHSAVLGMPLQRCLELDRGMAVLRTVVAYLRPALLDEQVEVATWLLPADSKLQVRRRFQGRRVADGTTLVRAEIAYVCIQLSTGRPMRWPAEFHSAYAPSARIAAASALLPPL
jgi:acyl-CoA thioester hydrolase